MSSGAKYNGYIWIHDKVYASSELNHCYGGNGFSHKYFAFQFNGNSSVQHKKKHSNDEL